MAKTDMELSPEEILFRIPEGTVARLRKTGPHAEIIGQERAVCAIDLGLRIDASGYNIFVMGASGTGRRTILTALLEKYKGKKDGLQDIVYVYNFQRPLEPKALFFPAGQGGEFKRDLHTAVEAIRGKISGLGKSDSFSRERESIVHEAESEESAVLSRFEADVAAEGFKLIQIKENDSSSMDLIPVIKGKEVPFDELQKRAAEGKISPEALNQLREKYYRCVDAMNALFKKMVERRRAVEKKVRDLRTQRAKPFIEKEISRIREKYAAEAVPVLSGAPGGTEAECAGKPAEAAVSPDAVRQQDIAAFLEDMQNDLTAHAYMLVSRFKSRRRRVNFFSRYEVNLFRECAQDGGSRVVQEKLPTFANLFGSIDSREETDAPPADAHLRLRCGAVHRAFGGFLVLRMQDLLLEEGAWAYLKRVLQSEKIEFQNPPGSMHSSSLIKPHPLPAKLKVVIIGGEGSYDFLYNEDPDFQKLFKICAAFDDEIPMNETNLLEYISFIDERTKKAGLPEFTDAGLARLLKEVARASGSRTKLSARFTQVSDLVYETACRSGNPAEPSAPLSAEDVAAAVSRRDFMYRLDEERFLNRIASREIIVEVSGGRVGKVNGLAVLDSGYHEFGIPVVVTAQAGPGDKGIINIEGEAGLSGEIYDKAHLIIQGLLCRKYLRSVPLFLTASVCFEQSYSGIDGDSASCAEFFALVSAISQIPLAQGIAVTGSLNQMGDVQPVGGIPQKIDGFFETCSVLGLTGTQGVIIPRRNLDDLILSDRLEQAVQEGRFHIWAVHTADEALEIISGQDSAAITINMRDALEKYAETMRELKAGR